MQRLAAHLIGSCAGYWAVRPGLICDVLQRSHLELDDWTGKQLVAAMNTTMRARGWHWPDRIDSPLGFLVFRIAQLPARPADSGDAQCVSARASALPPATLPTPQEAQDTQAQHRMVDRWYADVAAVTTAEQRADLLRAHEVKFGGRPTDPVAALAGAGRRVARLFPGMSLATGLVRWATETLGDRPAATDQTSAPALGSDLLMDLAISAGSGCAVCGSPRATMRPQLPLRSMSMVCDQCWPVIAADLAGNPDAEGAAA